MSESIEEVLLDEADGLATTARALGLEDLAVAMTQAARSRLEDAVVRVAVVGEIKHGKSSLINALVGEAVVPVGVTPTTGAAVVVRTRGPSGPVLVGASGEREPLDEARFEALARGKESADGRVEVGTDVARIDLPDVEILDTPGINDLDRVKTAVSRGQLPTADVLVVVLDATQLLNRTELGFLREAISAVGGLGTSGARLLMAVNRIDLVPADQHELLVSYLAKALPDLDVRSDLFLTNARGALRDPESDEPGVQGVVALRKRLQDIASTRPTMMPARVRAILLRNARLLTHHAAIAARALSLDEEALTAEIEQVRRALTGRERDLEVVTALLGKGRERILREARTRSQHFREELELTSMAIVQVSTLKILSSHLPGSIHDACVAFVRRESDVLRTELDDLTRKALHTHDARARQRLARATLRLGVRGPTVFIDPPSLALEASAVAVGLAGTAIMYFGNLVAGMVMTVAGPLATVAIREQSVRKARERAQAVLPGAIEQAALAIDESIERVVDEHVAAVHDHIELAENAIGEQLVAVLKRALGQLEGDDEARTRARARLAGLSADLQTRIRRLEALPLP